MIVRVQERSGLPRLELIASEGRNRQLCCQNIRGIFAYMAGTEQIFESKIPNVNPRSLFDWRSALYPLGNLNYFHNPDKINVDCHCKSL
jgi:hypothetical protein